jgi:adenylyltransferase/sulfurtransferase
MSTLELRKPALLSHFYILCDPPDEKGDEVLHFISEKRRIKVKGHSFREFQRAVIPLLDGQHTVEEIVQQTKDVFAADDLVMALQLLADQGLIEEGEHDGHLISDVNRIRPQLNYFHALGSEPVVAQARLESATVSILGAGAIGATAAVLLAPSHVGTLRIVDDARVSLTDTYLAPEFDLADVGSLRAEKLSSKIRALSHTVSCVVQTQKLETDSDVQAAIAGSDYILGAVDAGQSSLLYKLNRVCAAQKIPWIAATTSATEVIVGPTMKPQESACYLCYKMRAVACAENPEDEFAFQSFLDRRKHDDSGQRANLTCGTAIAGSVAALEIIKGIIPLGLVATLGHVIIFDLMSLSTTKHHVLRKPWCPVCFPKAVDH